MKSKLSLKTGEIKDYMKTSIKNLLCLVTSTWFYFSTITLYPLKQSVHSLEQLYDNKYTFIYTPEEFECKDLLRITFHPEKVFMLQKMKIQI